MTETLVGMLDPAMIAALDDGSELPESNWTGSPDLAKTCDSDEIRELVELNS
jgi:hypothetical protein